MAGSQRISVESGWDTSRMVCWCHLDPPKLPLGGSEIAPVIWSHICPEMTVLWHFGALYGHKNGPKGEILMATNWISTQPDPTDEIKSLWSPIKHVAKQS